MNLLASDLQTAARNILDGYILACRDIALLPDSRIYGNLLNNPSSFLFSTKTKPVNNPIAHLNAFKLCLERLPDFQSFTFISSLKVIDVSFIPLGDFGATNFLKAISRSPLSSLEVFCANSSGIGDQTALAVSALVRSTPSLRCVEIASVTVDGTDPLSVGTAALARRDSDEFRCACSLFAALAQTFTLSVRWVKGKRRAAPFANSVTSVGARALLESLEFHTSLQRLDLRGNSIGSDGRKAAANFLFRAPALEFLGVSISDGPSDGALDEGARALLEAAPAARAPSQVVDFGWCEAARLARPVSDARAALQASERRIGKAEKAAAKFEKIRESVEKAVTQYSATKEDPPPCAARQGLHVRDSLSQLMKAIQDIPEPDELLSDSRTLLPIEAPKIELSPSWSQLSRALTDPLTGSPERDESPDPAEFDFLDRSEPELCSISDGPGSRGRVRSPLAVEPEGNEGDPDSRTMSSSPPIDPSRRPSIVVSTRRPSESIPQNSPTPSPDPHALRFAALDPADVAPSLLNSESFRPEVRTSLVQSIQLDVTGSYSDLPDDKASFNTATLTASLSSSRRSSESSSVLPEGHPPQPHVSVLSPLDKVRRGGQFSKTAPITEQCDDADSSAGRKLLVQNRLSIRYGRGDAAVTPVEVFRQIDFPSFSGADARRISLSLQESSLRPRKPLSPLQESSDSAHGSISPPFRLDAQIKNRNSVPLKMLKHIGSAFAAPRESYSTSATPRPVSLTIPRKSAAPTGVQRIVNKLLGEEKVYWFLRGALVSEQVAKNSRPRYRVIRLSDDRLSLRVSHVGLKEAQVLAQDSEELIERYIADAAEEVPLQNILSVGAAQWSRSETLTIVPKDQRSRTFALIFPNENNKRFWKNTPGGVSCFCMASVFADAFRYLVGQPMTEAATKQAADTFHRLAAVRASGVVSPPAFSLLSPQSCRAASEGDPNALSDFCEDSFATARSSLRISEVADAARHRR
eukprot:gnl/Chilomastix_cuspidata/3568.p1 GENE.gnl/Chilomastix_cuspidata/3568~~gnl/Chilomastix_cuspidata/3568.p1  ORF type:complete len:1023 (+),score=301.80 gnl/Chilomastix_cuspidata/3568:134-3070(+)